MDTDKDNYKKYHEKYKDLLIKNKIKCEKCEKLYSDRYFKNHICKNVKSI